MRSRLIMSILRIRERDLSLPETGSTGPTCTCSKGSRSVKPVCVLKDKKPTRNTQAPLNPIITTQPFKLVSLDFLHLERKKHRGLWVQFGDCWSFYHWHLLKLIQQRTRAGKPWLTSSSTTISFALDCQENSPWPRTGIWKQILCPALQAHRNFSITHDTLAYWRKWKGQKYEHNSRDA